MILTVMMEWLSGRSESMKMSLMSTQRKMINVYRWEIIKVQQRQATPSTPYNLLWCVIFYNTIRDVVRIIIYYGHWRRRGVSGKSQHHHQSRTFPSMQHSLKSIISEILFSNTAYDCMPINSSMSSIDKSLTLRAAIEIFVSENIEELLVWDEGEGKWLWMLTTADIIRLIMHSVKCLHNREPIST